MTRLGVFGSELWTAEGPTISFYGFHYPTRMAIARLANGDLFVWSPVALDEMLQREVDTLGRVAHLVSPNKLHHLYLAQWKSAYPAAKLYASPGLAGKRQDLDFEGELGDIAPTAWSGQIDQIRFSGSPLLTEIVFFHRASNSVLFCDLIQNFPKDWFSGWRGLAARWDGIVAPDCGAPREWRLSFFRRGTARNALARILEWQPQRVVIAHGEDVRENGEQFIRRAFRWLV